MIARNLFFFFKEFHGILPNILNINNTLLDDPWIKEVIKDTRKYFEQVMMKENHSELPLHTYQNGSKTKAKR